MCIVSLVQKVVTYTNFDQPSENNASKRGYIHNALSDKNESDGPLDRWVCKHTDQTSNNQMAV